MQKQYAIVRLPALWSGDEYHDLLCGVPVTLFHWARYHCIAGYSLGQRVTFYDSLEVAKGIILQHENERIIMGKNRYFEGILELEVDGTKIQNVVKLHELEREYDFSATQKALPKLWLEKFLDRNQVSENALIELNRKFQKSLHIEESPLKKMRAKL